MTSNELRRAFLDYFHERGHEIVPSSPLVPANDPTLLFTNAGMVQFKEVFLGNESRAYPRAVSAQRCVRAGGKHNDLDNVGHTARHHTFFEMLGNFSFGDYFKREAIAYSWEFLTDVLGIDRKKLWVTVFDDDDEAADIWLKEIGVAKSRFRRCGEKDNFWSMGETGPCGPCSEIFYDHGAGIPGGPPGGPDQEGDRYVEIWNLVFMQYDRNADGDLRPIPRPSVDTGMGLERIAAVMQGVHNNFDIDLFQSLIAAIRGLAGREDLDIVSARVVADHIRSCAFLVADGVLPANEGRGYVLRRIIRRAIRHGNKLGFTRPFFYRLVSPLNDIMGEACPELGDSQAFVEETLKQEEERFAETLEYGLTLLEEAIAGLKGGTIPGEVVFKLYDTYGFPVDLTADIARERDLKLDMDGFEAAMAEQRRRARAASRFAAESVAGEGEKAFESRFYGYEHLALESQVAALYQDGRSVLELRQGESGGVILEATPFYAESGGQVGDAGVLRAEGILFEVQDTQKQGKAHVHLGRVVQGTLAVGKTLEAEVDAQRRRDTVRNHSATHLLHAALRRVLGKHVTQKGSLVAPDRLRFDFSHTKPLTQEELGTIEELVNRKILENTETRIQVMPLEEALKSGAMSLFGEKYDAEVRVLTIADGFSVELCGGTHVARSGDIGLFKIIYETGIAAGVRRIEALTGTGALRRVNENQQRLEALSRLLRTEPEHLELRLEQLLERSRRQEKEIEQLKGRLASSAGDDMAGEATDVDGIRVLAKCLDGVDPKSLRETVDQLKNKLGTAALVLATVSDGKVSLVAGVTKDSTGRIQAGDLVNFVAQQVGGRGGGRPDMAQAGGNDPGALEAALAGVPDWVRKRLGEAG